jgi:hypothetical protein
VARVIDSLLLMGILRPSEQSALRSAKDCGGYLGDDAGGIGAKAALSRPCPSQGSAACSDASTLAVSMSSPWNTQVERSLTQRRHQPRRCISGCQATSPTPVDQPSHRRGFSQREVSRRAMGHYAAPSYLVATRVHGRGCGIGGPRPGAPRQWRRRPPDRRWCAPL